MSVQVEGPVSPEELVNILQKTIEEQGSAFRALRTEEEEKIRANRQLRAEQDAAYLESLKKDKVTNKDQQCQMTVYHDSLSRNKSINGSLSLAGKG